MTRRFLAAAAALGCSVVLMACGDDDDAGAKPTAAAPAAGTAPAPAAPQAARKRTRKAGLTIRSSRFGKVLFDGRGYVLYLFDKEKTKRSECYGACAKAWPPYVVKSKPKAGKGVDPKLIGTSRRRDGKLIATYAGHPLYYYEHDGKGQILCHDVVEFGGTWLVVQPDGRPAP